MITLYVDIMKKIMIIALALMVCAASFAQNGKYMYNKYSDSEGVSAVYISNAMFRMIGKLPEMEIGDDELDISGIVKQLDGMYVVSSTNPKVNENLRKDIAQLLKEGKYELLLEAKQDGEMVRMYTIGDKLTISTFMLTAFDKDEVTYICFDGRMDREEFERLMAESRKD